MKQVSMQITPAEFAGRCAQLQAHLDERNCSGVVLFDRDYILYYSGFSFIPTERPIAFYMNTRGEKGLFVPRLEVEHARANALINHVSHYDEYPGRSHPLEHLKQALAELGIGKTFAADQDGYPWILGYQGPALSQLLGASPVLIAGWIESQMMIKSPAEIALIRESVRWGHLAHVLLQRYTRPGLTETEVSQRASQEAQRIMLDTIGPLYRAQSPFSGGAGAGYRGQIGRNAAIPHAMANNLTFQSGDVLVTGAAAPVWGYHSELERTMIVGAPTAAQKQMFDHMLALQDLAFSAIQPGVPCSHVDEQVRAYYDKYELWPHWRHHVGHAIGLRYHEGPFLDLGDQTIIQPGMVFTVEPGLYAPELGGFRHSDTVLVTPNGLEMLTYYPRDLDSLLIPL